MNSVSRRFRAATALATLPLATVCAAALMHHSPVALAAAAEPAVTPSITITNYSFHPGTLTVKAGATVTWVNKDDDVHTIKSTDGPEAFNSPALDSGGHFGFTFHHAGTYHYVCTVHPYMHGVIVVR